jgi:intracellular multiplication protein IcmE
MSPEALKKLGYDAASLKNAGVSAADLKAAGFSDDQLEKAGFAGQDLQTAGINPKIAALDNLTDSLADSNPKDSQTKDQMQSLDKALEEQKKAQTEMKFQAKIQQKAANIQQYAVQLIQAWNQSPTQAYVEGSNKGQAGAPASAAPAGPQLATSSQGSGNIDDDELSKQQTIFIKTGDILFAVIDTAVNTDEPAPILATITNGALKGSKIIGNFNLPSNADKMVITFTTLSMKGVNKTMGISAYAIDPNTGRTALSGTTNHHYLQRYGALFASTFLEGFGNAFQSANTTITIGGTGGVTNTSVQNGIGRSLTSNAVIGLATVGKSWGQQARQNMNIPTTVQVYSGTPVGVLFLQDVSIDPNNSGA